MGTIFLISFFISCFVFFRMACSSSILDAAEKIFPDSATREKNLIASLNTLKNMRLEALRQPVENDKIHKSIDPATVLCISFLEPSFKHLAIAEFNMKVSAKFCDWGILHVGDDNLKIVHALDKSALSNNVTLQFVEQSMTAEETLKRFSTSESEYRKVKEALGPQFKCKGIPKSFLLLQILPFARKYNYVWLLDSDITFEEFLIEKYFNTMRSLPQSPLLLQPVVGTNDRPHTRLNSKYYEGKQAANHIAPSNIIEIMLPMIDSGFLVWFANFFVKPMLGVSYAVSGDFGSGFLVALFVVDLYNFVVHRLDLVPSFSSLFRNRIRCESNNTLRSCILWRY